MAQPVREIKLTNKQKRVLDFIAEKGSISNKEAIDEIGEGRLSSVIMSLRRKGYNIKTVRVDIVNKYGEGTWYGKYVFDTNE